MSTGSASIAVECPYCHEPFTKAHSTRIRYCSLPCQVAAFRERNRLMIRRLRGERDDELTARVTLISEIQAMRLYPDRTYLTDQERAVIAAGVSTRGLRWGGLRGKRS